MAEVVPYDIYDNNGAVYRIVVKKSEASALDVDHMKRYRLLQTLKRSGENPVSKWADVSNATASSTSSDGSLWEPSPSASNGYGTGALPKQRQTGKSGKKNKWPKHVTAFFLNECKTYRKIIRQRVTPLEFWNNFSQLLKSHQVYASGEELREKMRNMKRTYHEARDKGMHKGKKWEHYSTMQYIFDEPILEEGPVNAVPTTEISLRKKDVVAPNSPTSQSNATSLHGHLSPEIGDECVDNNTVITNSSLHDVKEEGNRAGSDDTSFKTPVEDRSASVIINDSSNNATSLHGHIPPDIDHNENDDDEWMGKNTVPSKLYIATSYTGHLSQVCDEWANGHSSSVNNTFPTNSRLHNVKEEENRAGSDDTSFENPVEDRNESVIISDSPNNAASLHGHISLEINPNESDGWMDNSTLAANSSLVNVQVEGNRGGANDTNFETSFVRKSVDRNASFIFNDSPKNLAGNYSANQSSFLAAYKIASTPKKVTQAGPRLDPIVGLSSDLLSLMSPPKKKATGGASALAGQAKKTPKRKKACRGNMMWSEDVTKLFVDACVKKKDEVQKDNVLAQTWREVNAVLKNEGNVNYTAELCKQKFESMNEFFVGTLLTSNGIMAGHKWPYFEEFCLIHDIPENYEMPVEPDVQDEDDEDEEPQPLMGNGNIPQQGKKIWHDYVVDMLLTLYQERLPKFRSTKSSVRHSTLFAEISVVLRNFQINVTWKQCKDQIASLLATFREEYDNTRRTGQSPATFPWFNVLEKMHKDCPSLEPPFSVSVGVCRGLTYSVKGKRTEDSVRNTRTRKTVQRQANGNQKKPVFKSWVQQYQEKQIDQRDHMIEEMRLARESYDKRCEARLKLLQSVVQNMK